MQKISPFLWFDRQAEEAAALYTSLFENSHVGDISRYGKEGFDVHHMPEGTAMTVGFTLAGQSFVGLNGGPVFTFNPSISFHIRCDSVEEVDRLWAKLVEGGKILMELGEYPFSKRYGWLQDTYGVSWQIIHSSTPFVQKFLPTLLFVGDKCGKAEEAINLYTSIFKQSKINEISRYPKGMEPDKEGTITFARFTLAGSEFGAMDSAHEHKFMFNEAISFSVDCESQEEVDYFWNKLTADGGEESMCGWLKDKFGVSWQINPRRLGELMADKDRVKAGRVMNAMLKMKKIDIAALENAYNG